MQLVTFILWFTFVEEYSQLIVCSSPLDWSPKWRKSWSENQKFGSLAQLSAVPTRPTKTSFNKTSLNASYSDIEVCVDESLYKHQNLLEQPQIPRKLCPKFHQICKIDVLGASNDGKKYWELFPSFYTSPTKLFVRLSPLAATSPSLCQHIYKPIYGPLAKRNMW